MQALGVQLIRYLWNHWETLPYLQLCEPPLREWNPQLQVRAGVNVVQWQPIQSARDACGSDAGVIDLPGCQSALLDHLQQVRPVLLAWRLHSRRKQHELTCMPCSCNR